MVLSGRRWRTERLAEGWNLRSTCKINSCLSMPIGKVFWKNKREDRKKERMDRKRTSNGMFSASTDRRKQNPTGGSPCAQIWKALESVLLPPRVEKNHDLLFKTSNLLKHQGTVYFSCVIYIYIHLSSARAWFPKGVVLEAFEETIQMGGGRGVGALLARCLACC